MPAPPTHKPGSGRCSLRHVAEACASFDLDDHNNAALILLLYGIAGIDHNEDRRIVAYHAIERIFARTSASNAALREFIAEWQSCETIIGSI